MEACGLTADRVNFLRREITVNRQLVSIEPTWGPPKSKKGFRTVPVASEIIAALDAHRAEYGTGPNGLLFTSARGNPVVASTLQSAWKRVPRGHAVPDWATPKELRHYYASLLIHKGCSVKQVQRALGHENASLTLDTYGHWWPNSDDELREAVEVEWRRPSPTDGDSAAA
jgi:integrase